ncbi:hypothetical protein V8F63_11240 [Brevundimonas sp. LF-1]|uniref:hypothetical protein n=1 Tax=Brevundimonas sp. LF-1 TaxID=3126100 RepID=UPI0030E4BD46
MPIASFRRPALLAAASGAVLLIAGAGAAQAQNAPGSATSVDDIVVTGTRVANRSRLDTVAPVDVVTAEALEQRGTTELAAQLAATVPALNFPARRRPTARTPSARPPCAVRVPTRPWSWSTACVVTRPPWST